MIASSWAFKDRVFRWGGCSVAGALLASGGADIREASGAEEGEIRLACGLHIVTTCTSDQPTTTK